MTFSAFQPLSDACRYLSEKDVDFASSLQRGFMQYGRFTEKQQHWVNVLLERAEKNKQPKAAPAASQAIQGLEKLNALFDKAKATGKKRLKMGFLDASGSRFIVSVAPETGNNAGHLYVKGQGGEYLGKVTPSGEFKLGYGVQAEKGPAAREALQAFVRCDDMVATAKVYAQATGECMFCCAELTDARSIAMSYGPICADNYGLPWGEEGRPAPKRARKAKQDPHALTEEEYRAEMEFQHLSGFQAD